MEELKCEIEKLNKVISDTNNKFNILQQITEVDYNDIKAICSAIEVLQDKGFVNTCYIMLIVRISALPSNKYLRLKAKLFILYSISDSIIADCKDKVDTLWELLKPTHDEMSLIDTDPVYYVYKLLMNYI